MSNPEQQPRGEVRTNTESRKVSHEFHRNSEQISHNPEKERQERNLAKQEALNEALGKEQYYTPVENETSHSSAPVASKASLKQSFGKTMTRVRSELSPQERVFSKFIHLPGIEKASDIVASTVARPDAIVSGSVCALIITGGLYITARYFGFSLSGSETMAAFVIGWLIGILFDVTKGAIKHKR